MSSLHWPPHYRHPPNSFSHSQVSYLPTYLPPHRCIHWARQHCCFAGLALAGRSVQQQPTLDPTNQPINQLTNQPTNQPTNHHPRAHRQLGTQPTIITHVLLNSLEHIGGHVHQCPIHVGSNSNCLSIYSNIYLIPVIIFVFVNPNLLHKRKNKI